MKNEAKNRKKVTSAFEDIYGPGEKATNLEIRATLMMKIEKWIQDNEFTQEEAGRVLGIPRTRVSNLLHGHIEKFTIDKLVNMLSRTGQTVTFRVTKAA